MVILGDACKPRNFVLTPYDIGRVEICAVSACYSAKRDKPTFGQWWGIGIHRFLEYAKKYGRTRALSYVRKKFKGSVKTCEKIDLDAIPDGETEQAFLLDTQRGEAFAGAYFDAEPDTHIYAKSDLVHYERPPNDTVCPPNIIHVTDYKTGAAIGVDPRSSPQIKTIATALWLQESKPAFIGGHVAVIAATGDVAWRNAVFTAQDMEAYYKQLRRVHLQVLEYRAERVEEKIESEFTPGDHCKYCSLCKYCEVGTQWLTNNKFGP